MRAGLALALALCPALPAAAWDFTPLPVCTLTHATATATVRLTHDPAQPEPYAIAVTRAAGWPAGAVFAIRFDGGRALTIQTTRHVLSDGGRRLTVTDRGFGNVLDGLEFNATATALTGPAAEVLDLDGAAEPVRAFRACATAPVA